MHSLYYDKEAAVWEEALPLGNGRLGAMVWSGLKRERLSLNEDTLWSGYKKTNKTPLVAEHYAKARELALAGKYREAQEYVEAHLLGPYTQGYLPMGELALEVDVSGDATDYSRILDIRDALNKLEYKSGGVTYKRESFISFPDQVLVMKISADKPKSISFKASLSCQLKSQIYENGKCLSLEGTAPSVARPIYHMTDEPIAYSDEPDKKGISFLTLLDIEAVGGSVKAADDSLTVTEADEVIIRLCCRTSFNHQDYKNKCEADLKNAVSQDYESLKEGHIKDYRQLYDRVDISFGTEENAQTLPQRLANWEKSEKDPSLFALLFNYGRYLMIAGSRPGSVPLNLQGIWNPHLHPPWSSNFTININTEMNYWPAEVTNLSECHEPLISFIDRMREPGAETAKALYGAGGFTAHHNSDLWGHTSAVGENGKGTAVYAFWPLGAGWLSAHVYDHYLYTQDKKFLQDTALPILHDAARFYLDVLAEDENGKLIFSPSTSPENKFIHEGEAYAVSKTTTMTTAIVKETLSNLVASCDKLGQSPPIREEAANALKRLPEYKIGSRGELLEWSEELPENEPAHRHTSHLYPLHPGNEIKAGTALARACAGTLELRGGEGTGWALAWRINLWARMQEAEKAFACLKKQLRPATNSIGGCYANLFGAHPPFQIDSNFGACAGIAEMLMQSNADNEILLLPALPAALGTGYVKGLRARGGVTVSLTFSEGALEKAEFTLDSHLPKQSFSVFCNNQEYKLDLEAGATEVICPPVKK